MEQLWNAVCIKQAIDLADLTGEDAESHDRDRTLPNLHDDSRRSVDSDRLKRCASNSEGLRPVRDFPRAVNDGRDCRAGRTAVCTEHDIRMQDLQKLGKVSTLRRREERVDDLPLGHGVAVVAAPSAAPGAAASAAGKLPRCIEAAIQKCGDFGIRTIEKIVQHEGNAFRRRQGFEHDLKGKPYFLCELHFLFRIRVIRRVDKHVGNSRSCSIFVPRLPRT